MSTHENDEPENMAYQRLKATIDINYPKGWFVGIGGDQIVADAANFRELERLLRERGYDPRGVLVVEAGVVYPNYVTIFI